MTKKFQKFLSVILLTVMCIGTFIPVAYADEDVDTVLPQENNEMPAQVLEAEAPPLLEVEKLDLPTIEETQPEEVKIDPEPEVVPEPKPTKATLVVHFRNKSGEWDSKSSQNSVPWSVGTKKYGAMTGVKEGNPGMLEISVTGGKYKFTGWTEGDLAMTENITYEVWATYEFIPKYNLTFKYTDDVAHGSGSWATVNNVNTMSYTHTFKAPGDVPAHYTFLYWDCDGEQIPAGGSKSVKFDSLKSDTTITFQATYKYQPAVQLNYHYLDNTKTITAYEDIDIYGQAPISGKWFYGNESSPISEGSVASLPDEIVTTTERNDIKVVDVYAHYYTVKWLNDNGAQLQEDLNVPYGTVPEFLGKTPTKKATDKYTYSFKGWTPQIVPVTEDATYIAQFTETAIPKPTTKYYTITFLPGARGTFEPVSYRLKKGAAMPAAPTATGESGFAFIGWSPAIGEKVTDDATFVAQWEEIVVPVEPEPEEPPVIPVRSLDFEEEEILDEETPLAVMDVWALANLILLVLTIFTLVKFNRRYTVFAPIVVMLALGFFLVTENIRNPMVIFDRWTIWQLAIYVIAILARLLGKKEKSEEEKLEKDIKL